MIPIFSRKAGLIFFHVSSETSCSITLQTYLRKKSNGNIFNFLCYYKQQCLIFLVRTCCSIVHASDSHTTLPVWRDLCPMSIAAGA